jgi:glycosyltransferase involved in cell wall biosynthesis
MAFFNQSICNAVLEKIFQELAQMTQTKVLVVAPQPFFSPRGTPLSVYYRTLVTSELGLEIDLLTYGEGQDVDIPGVRIIRIPRFKAMGNVNVGPSLLKLYLDIYLVLWSLALLVRNKYNVVHAHEEAVFFCRFLKPIFGFKLIYDMHSSLPQQLSNFRYTHCQAIIRIFKKLEVTCLRNSDAVITICPDLADYAMGQLTDTGKHFLVENSIFEPIKMSNAGLRQDTSAEIQTAEAFIKTLPPGKRFVLYAGTLEPYQGIDLLLEAYQKVVVRAPDSLLLILGGNNGQVEHYKELAERLGIGCSVSLTGRVSQQVAQRCCRHASVVVSPRTRGTNTPLKIYEQLASGIPLVATNINSHSQVLNRQVAYMVDPNAAALADGICAALQPNGDRQKIAANARRLYNASYARPVYENKIKAIFNHLLSCVE